MSKSREKSIKEYLAGQREHHRTRDFKSELLWLLRENEVEFDERYVFD